MKNPVDEIFSCFLSANPSPTTELVYASDFELLISVMLSAQATDVRVNLVTKILFQQANTPETILALGRDGLVPMIKTIGLYNAKADHILATCQLLVQNHYSQVPNTRQELESLPGVGRKTANVMLNTAFGQPTLAVDTHIFRVAKRLGLADGKTPLAVERQLLQVIPQQYLLRAHHWLILHGRYVCRARKPACGDCQISQYCQYYRSLA